MLAILQLQSACLRDLPQVKRQRKKSAKATREQSAAVIAALQDVQLAIRAKLIDNPEWQRGYHSAMTCIEARISQERAK